MAPCTLGAGGPSGCSPHTAAASPPEPCFLPGDPTGTLHWPLGSDGGQGLCRPGRAPGLGTRLPHRLVDPCEQSVCVSFPWTRLLAALRSGLEAGVWKVWTSWRTRGRARRCAAGSEAPASLSVSEAVGSLLALAHTLEPGAACNVLASFRHHYCLARPPRPSPAEVGLEGGMRG